MNDLEQPEENGAPARPPYRGGYDEPAPQNDYRGYNEPAPQNGYRGYNEPAPQNGYRGYNEPAPQNGYREYNEPAPQNGYRGYNEPAPQNGYREYNEPAPQNGYRGYNEPAPQNGYREYNEPAPQNGYREYNEPAPQNGYRGYDEPAPQNGYREYDEREQRGGYREYDEREQRGGYREYDEREQRGGYREYDERDQRGGYREYDEREQYEDEQYARGAARPSRQPHLDDRFDSGMSRQEYRARLDRLSDTGEEDGEPYNPYTPVHGGARKFNLNNLTSGQLTLLLVAAFIVIIGLIILAATFATSSCADCSGGNNTDIPVIEQGDGFEGNEGFEEIISSTDDDPVQEVVTTSDGDVTINEELETDTFTVTVTNADGTYFRTDVKQSEAATLKISSQNETGFAFSLNVNAESASGTLAGHAYFCAEREAVYEGATGMLNFNFGDSGITIYMTDTLSAFDAEGVYPDGKYSTSKPVYIEDEAAKSETLGYDANIRTSQPVRDALAGIMPATDLTLMDFIFENGTFQVFENAEKGYDKNGTPINIDAQIGAVKYYGFINGTGEEVVLICTSDAKVYAGICNGAEYRYYTNDPAYADSAPKAIAGQAKGKGMSLIYN